MDYLKAADALNYSILREEWRESVFVTLHGYLRILPPDFTKASNIYNGHPGAIEQYPELVHELKKAAAAHRKKFYSKQ